MQGKNEIFIKSGAVAYINEYYPFGLVNQQTSSTQFGSKEQRYKYNGKELMKDFKLESSDFGSRLYNPQIARWSVLDKKADANPSWTPYRAFYNNPMKYVDPDGNIELPASMAKSHPNFYNYMKNNYSNDVMKSCNITDAMIRNSHGNISEKQVLNAVKFGSGPKFRTEDNVAKMNLDSRYDKTEKSIVFSKARIDNLEKLLGNPSISDEEKFKALSAVFMGISHETVHYLDYLDGDQYIDKDGNSPDVGNQFDLEVWQGNWEMRDGEMKSEQQFFGNPYIGADMDKLLEQKFKGIGKQDFPTLPESKKSNK
jgi:RHS repeat-associated protein